jgi:hypothetical protein
MLFFKVFIFRGLMLYNCPKGGVLNPFNAKTQGGIAMIGFLVEVTKTKENGGGVVAKWVDYPNYGHFFSDLKDLEKNGKALCVYDGGGYPYKYTAKATDVMPLIEKGLNARPDIDTKGSFWMMGYGIVPNIPVATTKNIIEIPACSTDETLLLELWDLS